MIRILRVSNHPSKKRHGVGLHSHKISETNKFETFFVSSNLDAEDSFLKPENYTIKVSNMKSVKKPAKVSFTKTLFFHSTRIFKLISFSIFCIKVARKNKVQVVHIHSPMYLLVAVWGKMTGKTTCITYHGTDYLRIKDVKIYRFFSKKFIEIGFCISPHMIEKMQLNHNKTKYIPNGIDASIFYNKEIERQKVLLSVGSLKKEKSYDNLIKAFKRISKDFPEYQLHIAGDGHLKQELKSLAKVEDISEKVIFCGNLDKNQLIEKYNTSEFFILSSYTEGFPKVVLEAIFCGCKVVATDVGSISTFLPKEYVIPDDSVDSLSKYIFKIFNESFYDIDKKELESKYTWLNVIQNYERVYKDYIN